MDNSVFNGGGITNNQAIVIISLTFLLIGGLLVHDAGLVHLKCKAVELQEKEFMGTAGYEQRIVDSYGYQKCIWVKTPRPDGVAVDFVRKPNVKQESMLRVIDDRLADMNDSLIRLHQKVNGIETQQTK